MVLNTAYYQNNSASRVSKTSGRPEIQYKIIKSIKSRKIPFHILFSVVKYI
jgi:hypothetical protein